MFLIIFLSLLQVSANQNTTLNELPDNFDQLKEGASVYYNCYYCHSLKPNLHLTGPSLSELGGKPAAQVKGYELYSQALKEKSLVWDESNLRKWVEHPSKLVESTTMSFEGLSKKENIDALLAFLKIAMGPNGFQKVVDYKLLSPATATGQLPKNLATPTESDIVKSIEHCGTVYTLYTIDKKQTRHWEMNIDFKIDSSESGPPNGKPVRIASGSMGDRFSIIFRSLNDLKKTITQCKKTKK